MSSTKHYFDRINQGTLRRAGAPGNGRAVAFYQRHGFAFLPGWEALASHPHVRVQKMACALGADLLSIDAPAISIG